MRKKEKQKYFMEKLHKIYNDKNLNLTETCRKKILDQYKELSNNKTNINYASYKLYPYLRDALYDNKDSELLGDFMKIILKYRCKAYFAMILPTKFWQLIYISIKNQEGQLLIFLFFYFLKNRVSCFFQHFI